MKEQGTGKRKSPVMTPVRNNETTIDFPGISAISTGSNAKRGSCCRWTLSHQAGVFKPQKKLYRVPGTVKRERRSAGGGGDI